MTPPKKDSFEHHLKEAEGALEQLESGSLPLEESLAVYERGIGALKRCYAILASAEQKVEKLIAEKDEPAGPKKP
jgi:exodeoxyribonuclease VII small subunit